MILVLFPGDIDMFRATQRRQDKAQSAENGESLSRAATPYWRRCVAPCGRAGKRSPAALRRLARTRHSLRGAPGAQPLPDPLNMSISPGKSTSMGFWTGGIHLTALIKVIATTDNGEYDNIYRYEDENRIVFIPFASENEKWLNEMANGLVEQIFKDRALLNHLAE